MAEAPKTKTEVKTAIPAAVAKPFHAATTRAQEHKAKLVAALSVKFKGLLKSKLGIDANPTGDVVEVNGKTFTIHGSSIFVIAPCPKCGAKMARITPVNAADEVDAVIKTSAVAYHHCSPKPVVAAVVAPAK
jgi:hypothetical protein